MDKMQILDNSLTWTDSLTGKKRSTNNNYLKQLRRTDTNKLEQPTVWESGEMIKWRLYVDQELNQPRTLMKVDDKIPTGGASLELYINTQVILNMLNSELSRFHNLYELPGLESYNPKQLEQFSNHLYRQGWIEKKVVAKSLLVKLTMRGKMFAEQHNAWV